MPKEKIAVHCSFTKMVPIEDVLPNPRNPNTHPQNQIDLLATIIRKQGWRAPITVSNRSGFVVRGHCRRLAALALGLKTVPIDYQDYASEEEEHADLIADNRIAELAVIDDELMVDLIGDLGQSEIEMELTGFESEMLDEYLENMGNGEVPDFQPTDESEQPRLDEKNKTKCPECGHEF